MKAVGSFPIWLPSLDTRSHAGEWPLEVVRIGESEKGNPLWDVSTHGFFERWAAERFFAGKKIFEFKQRKANERMNLIST